MEMFASGLTAQDKGYTVGLLSNAEMAAMAFFHEQGYAMFDAAVFSCAEGTRKPEQRIYEIALERFGGQAARGDLYRRQGRFSREVREGSAFTRSCSRIMNR